MDKSDTFIFFIVGVIIVSIPILMGACLCPATEKSISYPLISLETTSRLEGYFFLGTGYINQREYYFIYIKQNEHEIIPIRIPKYESIIMQGYENPVLEKIININLFGQSCGIKEYKFYVPKNTIIKKLNFATQS